MKDFQKLILGIEYIESKKRRVSKRTPTSREDCGTPFTVGDDISNLLSTLRDEFSIGGDDKCFRVQAPLYSKGNLITIEVKVLDRPGFIGKEKYVIFTLIS